MKILETVLRAFNASQDYIKLVENELELVGVTDLEDFGPMLLHTGVHVVGKGQNSVVLRGRLLGDFICSCKILRPDAARCDLLHEARAILHAQRVGVGPRLLTFTKHVLVYEYIDGVSIEKWIKSQADRSALVKVLTEVLHQAYRLDSINLIHDELSRPREHILVTSDLRVYIIDFETSSIGSRSSRRNLTQVLNALLLGKSDIASLVRRMLNLDESALTRIREYAKKYKKSPSIELVEDIIKAITGSESAHE